MNGNIAVFTIIDIGISAKTAPNQFITPDHSIEALTNSFLEVPDSLVADQISVNLDMVGDVLA